jgi:hypothetical protein
MTPVSIPAMPPLAPLIDERTFLSARGLGNTVLDVMRLDLSYICVTVDGDFMILNLSLRAVLVGWARTEPISPGWLLGCVDRLECLVTMASKISSILSDGVLSCVKVAVCVLTENLD